MYPKITYDTIKSSNGTILKNCQQVFKSIFLIIFQSYLKIENYALDIILKNIFLIMEK